MDECQKDPKLCSNGICRNTPGSFECICGDGYVLAKGTTACVGKSGKTHFRCKLAVDSSGTHRSVWDVLSYPRERTFTRHPLHGSCVLGCCLNQILC